MWNHKKEFAEDSNEAYCSVGAIGLVTEQMNKDGLAHAAENALAKYITENIDSSLKSIPSWNDVNGRTLDEVREAFLMAAKDLRNNAE